MTPSNLVQVILTFVIAALGIPALSGWMSLLASACGYAFFWQAIEDRKAGRFWIGAAWFAGVQAVQLHWMVSPQYMGLGIIAVYLFVCLAIGLQFGFLTQLVRRSMTWPEIFGCCGLWVFMEWSRLFFLTGFPWNPIGLSLSANGYSIQMASLFGIYGLCFWVIFVNLVWLKKGAKMVWLCLALFPYGYGLIHQQIIKHSFSPGKELSAALVQTALRPEQRDFFRERPDAYIPPLEQWDMLLSHLSKTQQSRFDLIVLPEGALPYYLGQAVYPTDAARAVWQKHFGEMPKTHLLPFEKKGHVSNAFWIQSLANHFQAEVIVGLNTREGGKIYNTAVHAMPHQKFMDRYAKQILIPIGEYIPFGEWKWLANFAEKTFGIKSSFSSEKQGEIFEGALPIGVFICLEEAYSQFIRNIRCQGASLFVNLTNDVWFPGTGLPWHHFDHGRVRAVENGVCLLRATNTGVTAAVDCFGSPLAIFPPSGKESGVLEVKIIANSYSTLYTYFGDLPILILCFVFFCFGIRKRCCNIPISFNFLVEKFHKKRMVHPATHEDE